MKHLALYVRQLRQKIFISSALLLAGIIAAGPLQTIAAPPADFQNTPIVSSGLDGPSGFEIAPDGRIFILERAGKVKIYKDGQLLPTPFAELPAIAAGDRGLIGIAFDPEFATNCYVYFYFTSASDLLNRLVRYNACGDVGTDGPRTIYQTNSPSQELHVGGSVQFGADGKLYLAVGDNGYPPNGQDLSNPHGKILRINKDGTIPADNPFFGQAGKLGEIWAYGMRNPWRFQFDPANGRMYGGDVGDYSWEEINQIVRGGNYGWPLKEGDCRPNCEGTLPPVYAYPHDGASAAVTGGPVYRSTMFPEQFRGDLFFADYAKGFIRHMDLDAEGNSLGVHDFDAAAGSVVDLKVGQDGALYYITYYPGRLYRVTYNTGNGVPTAQAAADVTKGIEPLSVQFSSAGSSDPDGTPLTYMWDFGDSTTSTTANPTKIYEKKGSYTVELTVSDGVYSAKAVPLVIQVGTPPTVRLSAPTDGTIYKAGDSITYNAFAQDAAGFDIDDGAISTDVLLHHATHTHPYLDNLVGRAQTFVIPDHGEASADTWYEIITTATDTNGLSATAAVRINPQVVGLTFGTNIPGIGVQLDGVPYPNPHQTSGVTGFKRELSAVPIQKGSDGQFYQFDKWSDGGAIRHQFTTPGTDTAYSASYSPAPAFTAEYFDNPDLAGAPKLIRQEPEINNSWLGGSPDVAIPADLFSARYKKSQYFVAGRYKFTAATDDGVRLYVDGKQLINVWAGNNQAHSATVDLAEGMHDITMEYMEQYGDAHARLSWDTTPDQPTAPIASEGFAADYYDNPGLTGTPVVSRTDTAIDFDWAAGSPAASLPADNFSARWTKVETMDAGTYSFTVTADDGVRLIIDGEVILDKWIDQAPTTYTVQKTLTEGRHTLQMEYYERGGGAVARLAYARATEPVMTTGYTGEYWNTPTSGIAPAMPTGAADLTRQDESIVFDWASGSPDAAINLDHFIARWTKSAAFEDGNYRFTVRSDDGIRVFIDDQLVIDRWFDQGGDIEAVQDMTVTAGSHTVRVEYYENAGGATAQFAYAKVEPAVTEGYRAKYWNITAGSVPAIPTTAPTVTRTDAAIDFDWAGGSPDVAIRNDYFVAEWTRAETFAEGVYDFRVTADDGVRLSIDGVLILDRWVDQPPTTYTLTRELAAGSHDIKLEYYEKAGGAVAKLSYQPVVTQEYYEASYWNTPTAGTAPAMPTAAPDVYRREAAVDHDWAGGSPDAAIANDHFIGRWMRQTTTAAGIYRFTTVSDDGIRLYVDGVLRIDQWNDHAPTTHTADIALEEGLHDIRLEFYENAGGAVAKLNYIKL